MLGFTRIFLCVTVVACLMVSNAYSASVLSHKVLTIVSDEKKKPSPFQFELREAENGLKVSIRLSDTTKKKVPDPPPGIKIGGDYIVFLDDIIVINESYQGESLDISRDVPLTALQKGKHSLRCELRAPSGEVFKHEIQFIFDGSPAISVTEAVVDKSGMFDPAVTINFLGGNNEAAGFVDIFLDDRPFVNVPIKKETAGKKMPLSQITGKPLSTAGLALGTHLLTIRATGINGNATVNYTPFTVNTTPDLKIIKDKNDAFQEAVATFLKSPEGYSGSVDIVYNQNLILSKRDEGTTLSIKRAEIVEAFKKNSHELSDSAVPVVFSLRAANGTVNWQKIDFK